MSSHVNTSAYRLHLAHALCGQSQLSPIAFLVVGDGGHDPDSGLIIEPSADWTALQHEVFRKPISEAAPSLASVTVSGVLSADDLIDTTISEVGLLAADSTLVAAKTFTPVVKRRGEVYSFVFDLWI